MNKSIIDWELLRTLDSSTIVSGSVWYPLGSPLLFPSYKLKMVNNSNITVTISKNGVDAIDVCPGSSFWLYDIDLGNQGHEYAAAGTQIYVMSASAGTGNIYLVSQYIVSQ